MTREEGKQDNHDRRANVAAQTTTQALTVPATVIAGRLAGIVPVHPPGLIPAPLALTGEAMKKQNAATTDGNTTAPPARRAQSKTARRAAAMRLLAYQIIADGFEGGDFIEQHWDRSVNPGKPDHYAAIVSDALGSSYNAHENKGHDLVDVISRAVPKELQDKLHTYVNLRDDECWAIANAMLELGRLAGRIETKGQEAPRRPTIDRFMSALESAVEHNALEHGLVSTEGKKAMLEQIKRAVPVAQAIALLGNPLDCTSGPIEKFVAELTSETDEWGAPGADAEGRYLAGLALGLILADQIGER